MLRILVSGTMLLLLIFISLSYYVNKNKQELILKATTAIHKNISGHITIGDLSVTFFRHFPSFSIRLINVTVTDSLYEKHRRPLLTAENLFVRLSTPALLRGRLLINKLTLRNGGIDVFTDSTGYSNAHLLKAKNPSPPGANESEQMTRQLLDWVVIENFRFRLEDVPGDKKYDININALNAKVNRTGSIYSVTLKKELLVNSLAFKKKNGSFIGNQRVQGEYQLQFDSKEKKLSFKDIKMIIGEQAFLFTGRFWLGKENRFDLHIQSKQLLVNFARSLLTPKISKAVGLADVKKPLDVNATIAGGLSGGDPRVEVKFIARNADLSTKWIQLKNASFTGEYLNERIPGLGYTDENSHIYIKELTGQLDSLPLQIRELKVMNLVSPKLSVQLTTQFRASDLNSVIQSKTLQFMSGIGEAAISYEGRTDSISSKNSRLRGFLTFNQTDILVIGPQAILKNCRSRIRFENANLIVDSLNANLAGQPVYMQGQANNVLSLLSDDHVPVSLNWNIYAPVINLNSIQSILQRKISAATSAPAKKTKIGATIENIDHLLSSGRVTASLRADRLQFQKMDARNFAADIFLEGNKWSVKKATLRHGDGSVLVTANVVELSPNQMKFSSTIDLKNVDAAKTFYAFENFGITGFGHHNLRGTLSANARYSLMMNGKGEPSWKTINGTASFSLKNGALLNFPPLMSIQKTAFKNRDFSHVRFAEIQNKLRLENAGILINRMAINSSVLTLFVQGIYGFMNNTDISIQVPLKNLKKKEDEAHPEFIRGDSKGGMSVFLRASADNTGKISIKYDPLARFRKK